MDPNKKYTKEEILDEISNLEDIIYHEADYYIADAAMYELKQFQKLLHDYDNN